MIDFRWYKNEPESESESESKIGGFGNPNWWLVVD